MKGVLAFRDEYLRIAFTPLSLRDVWSGRVRVLMALVRSLGLEEWLRIERPEPASRDDLLLVHDEEYVDYVERMGRIGRGYLDYGDTPAYPGVYEDALLAVGGTVLCVREVLRGSSRVCFNPQGGFHHARRSSAAGFCVFNDVALAAVLLRDAGRRVAVVDVDGHHGDGTQEILYSDPILKISTHMYAPGFYPGTGYINELGEGEGYGYSVNVPLPPRTGDDAFAYVLGEVIEPLLSAYKPDVVVLQCGADSHSGDPLVGLELTTLSYLSLAKMLREKAESFVVLAGGGYQADVAPKVWLTAVLTLVGAPDDVVAKLRDPEEGTKTSEAAFSLLRRRVSELKKALEPIHGPL